MQRCYLSIFQKKEFLGIVWLAVQINYLFHRLVT